MKDGYYVSTYLNPAGVYRLANARFRHDENLALWQLSKGNIKLIAHWEIERISGQKGHRTPFRSTGEQKAFVAGLLRQFGVELEDVREIWGTPGLSTGDDDFLTRASPSLAVHSIAHLYSAVLMDTDEFFGGRILGLAVDFAPDYVIDRGGRPDWYAGCFVDHGRMELFPVESPGALYCAARDRFGLREGTLMALATATTSQVDLDVAALGDGHQWFGRRGMLSRADSVIQTMLDTAQREATNDARFSREECVISAVMKMVQECCAQIMHRNVRSAMDRFGFDPRSVTLALAGGSALNCPTNSRLMAEFGFKGFAAPPSVADDGQAVGIGLTAFHARLGDAIRFRYDTAYLGPRVGPLEEEIRLFDPFVRSCGEFCAKVAAADLIDGPIVWVDGRSEVGPRALGHRSVLADPRTMESKDRLNAIKRREWWRPVAPMVLLPEGSGWFEDLRDSPYMLETFRLRQSVRDRVPAVSHLDDSARVQTVRGEDDADRVVCVLREFHRQTGVPMLCNTSLNDSGEPIIESVPDALNFALRKGIRVAYVHGLRVELQGHDDYVGYAPGMRSRDWFSLSEQDKSAANARLNPYGLSEVELYLHASNGDLGTTFDIRTESGAARARALARQQLAKDPELARAVSRRIEKNSLYFSSFGSYPLLPEPRFTPQGDASDQAHVSSDISED